MRVKVVKNKMAPPFKQAEFDVMFAEGISKVGELVDLGVDRRYVLAQQSNRGRPDGGQET